MTADDILRQWRALELIDAANRRRVRRDRMLAVAYSIAAFTISYFMIRSI